MALDYAAFANVVMDILEREARPSIREEVAWARTKISEGRSGIDDVHTRYLLRSVSDDLVCRLAILTTGLNKDPDYRRMMLLVGVRHGLKSCGLPRHRLDFIRLMAEPYLKE